MGVSINTHKTLGVNAHTRIVPPFSSETFDISSWAIDGVDDYLSNTVAYNTIQVDSGGGANVKWSVVFWAKLDNLT